MTLRIAILMAINLTLLVGGQILWKIGLNKLGGFQSQNSLIPVMTSPYTWAGIVLFGFATVVWLAVLGQAELSKVYPLQSLAYIFGMVAGIMIFGERVSWIGWAGSGFIFLGVLMIAGAAQS